MYIMKFCKTCLFKEINPLPISFNKDGICTGCLYAKKKWNIDWNEREKLFLDLTLRIISSL